MPRFPGLLDEKRSCVVSMHGLRSPRRYRDGWEISGGGVSTSFFCAQTERRSCNRHFVRLSQRRSSRRRSRAAAARSTMLWLGTTRVWMASRRVRAPGSSRIPINIPRACRIMVAHDSSSNPASPMTSCRRGEDAPERRRYDRASAASCHQRIVRFELRRGLTDCAAPSMERDLPLSIPRLPCRRASMNAPDVRATSTVLIHPFRCR